MSEFSSLPSGWVKTTLGELVSPSKEQVEPEDCPDAPYLGLEHVEAHTNRIIGRGVATDARSTKTRFRAGDVLYGKLRPYLNKVVLPDFGGICTTDMLVFPASKSLDNAYLLRFLSRPEVVEYAKANVSGINLPRVSFGVLGELTFPLPPLGEQRRIIERCDELYVRSQAAREVLGAIPSLLKRFRQSVLTAAFRGDLTADWRAENPNVEPASLLLDRIRAERCQMWENVNLKRGRGRGRAPTADRYEEPPLASTNSLPPLPHGWCWVPLGFLGADPLATVQTGPFGAQLHSSEFTESGVPVIAVGNLTGVGFTTKGLYHIPPGKAVQLGRYDVQAGDLLFARSGATLGKVCVAPDYVQDWRMTGHILRARLNQQFILPELAAFALGGAPSVQSQVTSGIRGMTRPGFNTSLLESIALPVPPLTEQIVILSQVHELFRRADTVELSVGNMVEELKRMDMAILAKAFRGELVPQDPSDEPAWVLLERIRAEREAESGAKRRGRQRTAITQ